MKTVIALFALFAGASVTTACIPMDCTLVGCGGPDEGLTFDLPGAAETFAANMPITITTCIDGACSLSTVSLENGAFECDDHEDDGVDLPDNRACFVWNEKDISVVINTPVGDEAAASVLIEDADGNKLFEGSTTVPIAQYYPNGEQCDSGCHNGTATFVAEPVSQPSD